MQPTRRSTLRALSALAAAAAVAPVASRTQAAGTISVAQFGAVSTALTGYPIADADTLGRMMRAFATPARRAPLAALAQTVAATPAASLDAEIRARNLDTLANDLVAAWYSGVVTTPQGPKLVLYTQAYVWSAMTYSKPMGVCGGVTGYWANPPA
jgi:hypothetical protein